MMNTLIYRSPSPRPVAINVVWGEFKCRRHSNEGADGWGLWREYPIPSEGEFWEGRCVHSPEKIVFSLSKWCILMHSGAHFTLTVIVTMMFLTSKVAFLSCTCSSAVQQKVDQEGFVQTFLWGSTLVSPPSEYGPAVPYA